MGLVTPHLGAHRASVLSSEGAAASTPVSKKGLQRLREDFKSLENRMTAFEKQRRAKESFLTSYYKLCQRITHIRGDLKKKDVGSLQNAAGQAKALADRYAQRGELSEKKHAGSVWHWMNSSAKEKHENKLRQMQTFELELSDFSEAVAALADEVAASKPLLQGLQNSDGRPAGRAFERVEGAAGVGKETGTKRQTARHQGGIGAQ